MAKGTHTPQKAERELKEYLHELGTKVRVLSTVVLFAGESNAQYRIMVRLIWAKRAGCSVQSFDVSVYDYFPTEIHVTR